MVAIGAVLLVFGVIMIQKAFGRWPW